MRRTYSCDTTHSLVCSHRWTNSALAALFICDSHVTYHPHMTWLICDMCHVTYKFICDMTDMTLFMTWLICDMTHVTYKFICDMTDMSHINLYVTWLTWHYLYVTWWYATWLIHMWHDSSTYDMAHPHATWHLIASQVWHHTFIRDTWLIHVCGMTHSYLWND